MTHGDAIEALRYGLVDVLKVRRPELEFEGKDVAAVITDMARYRDSMLRCACALAASAIGDRLMR